MLRDGNLAPTKELSYRRRVDAELVQSWQTDFATWKSTSCQTLSERSAEKEKDFHSLNCVFWFTPASAITIVPITSFSSHLRWTPKRHRWSPQMSVAPHQCEVGHEAATLSCHGGHCCPGRTERVPEQTKHRLRGETCWTEMNRTVVKRDWCHIDEVLEVKGINMVVSSCIYGRNDKKEHNILYSRY